MKRAILIVLAVTCIATAQANRSEWKHPWAGEKLNETVTFTRLELYCRDASFHREEDRITFTDGDGEPLLRFVKAEFEPGPIGILCDLHIEPVEGMPLTAYTKEVLRMAGMRVGNYRLRDIDIESLDIAKVMITRRTFHDGRPLDGRLQTLEPSGSIDLVIADE
ncbi:MAG: hypothetical protein ACP5HU_00280 [Phycisphaerae bacterium]